MSRTLISLATALTLTIPTLSLADNSIGATYAREARSIIKEYATTLKGELQAAVKNGGPVNAVEVCTAKAPAIATVLSEQTGWDVGRTSLKARNTGTNTPDEWEAKVLRQFADRQQYKGESPVNMTFAEVVTTDEGKEYRFMQAIPTGKVCLSCHGSNLDPTIAEAIDKAYPEDQARGFSEGDIRGAFTLSRPM